MALLAHKPGRPDSPALRAPLSIRRCSAWALAALVLGWSVGALAFLRADGTMQWTMPRTELPTRGEQNLVAYRSGPTLRASSYYRDVLSQHHPAFLVDGRLRPGLLEKWASGQRDTKPWLELSWREPRLLLRVKLWHAGLVESDDLTLRNYRLRCLGDSSEHTTLEVRDNREKIAAHPLRCAGARGVRIEASPNAGADRLVRLYEVEAWGQ